VKFGKLPNIANIDFKLPAQDPQTMRFLAQQAKPTSLPQIYIGCTGWSMKEWVGKVYPEKTKAKDYLKAYSKQFNTIEFNTTHYRIPSLDNIDKWKTESSPDFRFCPKILQAISHRNDLGLVSGQLLAFCDVIQGLEEKLGCCFMQLPPYFGYDRFTMLKQFIQAFPSDIPLAIELRHESWFNNPAHTTAIFDLLEANNIGTVITDVAGRRDVLHTRLTTNMAMIRFVGNDLHPTDYERIDEWVQRLKTWIDAGLSTVYFFTHEPDNINAPEMAKYLYEQITEACKVISKGPSIPPEDPTAQISLF